MKDYWVLTQQDPSDPAKVAAKLLDLSDVPWAEKQLWAPDATEKDGKYYLYFSTCKDRVVSRVEWDAYRVKKHRVLPLSLGPCN